LLRYGDLFGYANRKFSNWKSLGEEIHAAAGTREG